MPKTTDVPAELKAFNKIFEELSYRFQYSDVFNDFLDYWIYVINTKRDTKDIERIRSKYGKDYENLVKLWNEHLQTTNRMLVNLQWYDLLGIYYECLVSRSKSSAMGQFFTPPSLVDLIAQINSSEYANKTGLRVNDPACGSGRTLLAYHALYPGNYMFGDDLDPMCTKMETINLTIHGAQGQVCNTNSLSIDDWRFGYVINPSLYTKGLVSIEPITKTEAFTFIHWTNTMAKKTTPKPPAAEEQPPVAIEQPNTMPVAIEPGQEIEHIISSAIKQYNVTDTAIEALKDELTGLTIAGVDDKDGYEVVRKSIGRLRDLRTSVEKKRMELNRNAIDYKKAVDEEAKRITALLVDIETPLKEQKEWVDSEKARIKAEEEQKKQALFVTRTNALLQRGFTFNGSMYVNGDTMVTTNDVREFADGQWNEVLARAEELFQQAQAEAKAKAEAEAKAREEQAQKLAEQQRLIDEQNRQIQAQRLENERLQYENRTQWLINNGFKLDNAYWEKNGYGLPDMIVLKSPSETWKHELTQVLNNIKAAEEAIAKIGIPQETAPAPQATAPAQPAIAPAPQAKPNPTPRTYEQGYEECRQAVLALFTDGKQRIKAQYITEIQSLKPQQP